MAKVFFNTNVQMYVPYNGIKIKTSKKSANTY